jgi:hypothetical protein
MLTIITILLDKAVFKHLDNLTFIRHVLNHGVNISQNSLFWVVWRRVSYLLLHKLKKIVGKIHLKLLE